MKIKVTRELLANLMRAQCQYSINLLQDWLDDDCISTDGWEYALGAMELAKVMMEMEYDRDEGEELDKLLNTPSSLLSQLSGDSICDAIVNLNPIALKEND